jgi:PAS domain S-box-containing protein
MPLNDDALLRGLFDHASVGMAFVGTDGRWATVNRAMCKLVGYQERELHGQHFQAITHPDDRYKDASFVEKLLAGETEGYRVDKRYLHKDGHVVWAEVAASRIRAKARDFYLFVSQDIGSRKEMEQAFHHSEESFRVLIEGAPDSICVHVGGLIRYVNPAFGRLLGRMRADELVGETLAELLPLGERLRLGGVASGRMDERRTYDAHFLKKDGSLVFCEVSELPVVRAKEPSSVMFLRDLSAREASFRKLLCADRLAAMGTLAAGIAHEINNPLALVVANLELALETVTQSKTPVSNDELTEILTEAREGALRVSGVVRNMRQLGAMEGADDGDAQPVVVAQSLESVLRLMWNQLKHRANLTKDIDSELRVRARSEELEQLFLNLLLYAGRATAGDTALVSIVVRVKRVGASVVIEVTDSHPPLSDDQREHLFDPFYSSTTGGTGASEGGLGLAVSGGIVAQMKGEISAGSTLAGNLFKVTLPVFEVAPVSVTPALRTRSTQRMRVPGRRSSTSALKHRSAPSTPSTPSTSAAAAPKKKR